jgi:indole-3-glycerol phosphate synthase
MTDILKKIISTKRDEILQRKKNISLSSLESAIKSIAEPRGFKKSLLNSIKRGKPAIIAECKKASPSKGVICQNYDPAAVANQYQIGGASCISVLTDTNYFQGADQHLAAAKRACSLPILRKDFMIDPYQIIESRNIGADCILLIVACLSTSQIKELSSLSYSLGMDVLVEAHNSEELEIAMAIPDAIIGINNRDLKTFKTDIKTTIELKKLIPESKLLVTESGIVSSENIKTLRENGINSFLVGEAFMKTNQPGEALKKLFSLGPN